MKCPFCGKLDNKVVNSRLTPDEASIRRRRECLECGERFTTYETVERAPIWVVKRDGRRVPFDRQKLVRGLLRACEKRPVSLERIEALASGVEMELSNQIEPEISALRIGEIVLARLRELDEVAYVRFASVYRQFRDVSEFSEEIQGLLRKATPAPDSDFAAASDVASPPSAPAAPEPDATKSAPPHAGTDV
jgi:transcriptional repressor NrdR